MSTIKLKRSAVEGKVPGAEDLELGELAINTFDGKLYLKKSANGANSVVDVTSGAGLSAQDILDQLKTVDGTGSGLDADLLDGQNSAFYLDYNNFSNTPTIGQGDISFSGDSVISASGSFSLNDTLNTEILLSVNNAAISITESQITDLQDYLTSETITSLNLSSNVLTYTDETGANTDIDLSLYLDDTNLARLTSGTVAANGIATFTRDDASTFTVDFSNLLDDTNTTYDLVSPGSGVLRLSDNANANDDITFTGSGATTVSSNTTHIIVSSTDTNNYVNSASFNTSDGILTLGRQGLGDVAVDLDGRFLLSSDFTATANTWLNTRSTTDLSEGTNLYYTTARANTAIDTRVTKSFVDALNVDADTLDGANGTFYLDYNNFTNTPTIPQSGVDFDPVGTDNSTNVTLTGLYDYLTITGQQITLNQIDYNTDITNLPTLYTTADANVDIDARVTKTFVDALNVDADTLDGQQGSFYQNASNLNSGTISDARLPATISSDITGNAKTATTLETARNIALTGAVTGNANFDGSGNISIATTATADPTLTINGDASGSATFTNLGNATLTLTIADDSHNHVISNIDGLQTVLDGKLSTSGGTLDGGTNTSLNIISDDTGKSQISLYGAAQGTGVVYVGQSALYGGGIEYNGDAAPTTTGAGSDYITLWRRDAGVDSWTARNRYNLNDWEFRGNIYANTTQRVFADDYHPNADKWTTARTLTLSGAVTGSASIDGSGNVSLATTATSDPTLTLAGDVAGTATFTNLGNATLTATVADDSHNHTVSTITDFTTGANTAIDNRITKTFIDALNVDADTLDGEEGSYYLDWTNVTNKPDPTLTINGDASGSATLTNLGNATLTLSIADDSHNHTIANIDGLQSALDGKTTESYVDTQISNLVDSSPATLDTLNELAAALGDDPNFATTVANDIGTKADKSTTISAGSGLTGGGDLSTNRTISHADTSSQGSVNNSGSTVIQDVTLDGFGHVTNLNSKNLSAADVGALGVNDKAADSNLLDGINSIQFLRSDATDTASGNLTFTGTVNLDGDVQINSLFNINAETGSTTSTTQTAIATFAATTYSSAKFIVQASDSVSDEVHVTEILVVHDGTTASATEYGTIHTGAAPLATYDVDILSGNVRLLATAASTNSTTYKVTENLITA